MDEPKIDGMNERIAKWNAAELTRIKGSKKLNFQHCVRLILTFSLMCLFGYITYFYWFTAEHSPLIAFAAGIITLFGGFLFYDSLKAFLFFRFLWRLTAPNFKK